MLSPFGYKHCTQDLLTELVVAYMSYQAIPIEFVLGFYFLLLILQQRGCRSCVSYALPLLCKTGLYIHILIPLWLTAAGWRANMFRNGALCFHRFTKKAHFEIILCAVENIIWLAMMCRMKKFYISLKVRGSKLGLLFCCWASMH